MSVFVENKLLELAADEGLKMAFDNVTLAAFWIKVKAEYPELFEIAIKTLLPFPSTSCETGFSTMSVIKTKHRNALDICCPLRVALSSIEPRLEKLVKNKRAHSSH